jgi:pilus assembly protein Flp/PilA
MLNAIRQCVKEEEGASAAEYALLLALITLGIVVADQNLGTAISGALAAATGTINGAAS